MVWGPRALTPSLAASAIAPPGAQERRELYQISVRQGGGVAKFHIAFVKVRRRDNKRNKVII